MLVSKQFQIQV